MITIRKTNERGHFEHGWLDTYHTFSFDQYYDPNHMGFRHLRVINEDIFQPGHGFPMHPHRNMEIITYILEGELEHHDSMGNRGVIRPGEVQKMSAGRGITHSEANPSSTQPVHLLQIWILPDKNNIEPNYGQIKVDLGKARNKLSLFGSRAGGDAVVTIHQDLNLYVGLLDSGKSAQHEITAGRHVWIQVARGELQVNGQTLKAGDGAAVSDERVLEFAATDNAEFLVFDMS